MAKPNTKLVYETPLFMEQKTLTHTTYTYFHFTMYNKYTSYHIYLDIYTLKYNVIKYYYDHENDNNAPCKWIYTPKYTFYITTCKASTSYTPQYITIKCFITRHVQQRFEWSLCIEKLSKCMGHILMYVISLYYHIFRSLL